MPVFLKPSDDVEEASSKSAFAQVFKVVEAMRSQDEELVDIISKLKMFEGKRKIGSLKARENKEYKRLKNQLDDKLIILTKKHDFDKFIEAVKTKTIESVGQSWDYIYGQVIAFREIYGRFPKAHQKSKEEYVLNHWCNRQRKDYDKGVLDKSKIVKLESKGFVWSPHEEGWEENFNKLKKFYNKYGRGKEPNRRSKNKKESILGMWFRRQRNAYKENILTKERIEKLEKVGFFGTHWMLSGINILKN